ncbi:MAG: glycoside hydrolase family 38 C-terminal domain-containing protein, partial [Thermomicrobiales bacterium]
MIPANGFAFLSASTEVRVDDLVTDGMTIENKYYRLTVNASTGALSEWIDKQSGHNFAGSWSGYQLGQYIYETVDDPRQRDALFAGDFSAEDFGHGITDTAFVRRTSTSVIVEPSLIEMGEVSISASIEAPGIRRGRVTYRLRTEEPTLDIDWLLDKEPVDEVEAVFIAFPFALDAANFRADINGVPITPDLEQLPGTVRDWYPVGLWADVSDAERGVTLAPLDAPLLHLGGITTGRWARTLEPDGPNIMSWALNNHWMVNFQSHQQGEIPLRYRLTTHKGGCNDADA